MKTRSSSWEMYQELRDIEKKLTRETNDRNFRDNYFLDNYYDWGYLQPCDEYGKNHRHTRAW